MFQWKLYLYDVVAQLLQTAVISQRCVLHIELLKSPRNGACAEREQEDPGGRYSRRQCGAVVDGPAGESLPVALVGRPVAQGHPAASRPLAIGTVVSAAARGLHSAPDVVVAVPHHAARVHVPAVRPRGTVVWTEERALRKGKTRARYALASGVVGYVRAARSSRRVRRLRLWPG